jgi:hypothetical protein
VDGVTTRAKAFLVEILAAGERQFPSVGHGTDHRYRSSSPPKPYRGKRRPQIYTDKHGFWGLKFGLATFGFGSPFGEGISTLRMRSIEQSPSALIRVHLWLY